MGATFYTTETLAKLYHLPITTIRKFIRRGDIKNVLKVGKHYRVSHESRLKFEKEHLVNVTK